jgi:peptide-methionine (R)-S-oxide reductase
MQLKSLIFALTGLLAFTSSFCQVDQKKQSKNQFEVTKLDDEWKALLTPEQYEVLRNKGTEYAFTGEFYNNKVKGTYSCAGCGNELFESDTKYDSGCGWPSFFEPLDDDVIIKQVDKSLGMVREEILCAKCGGHLGHVFNDGPKPTGLRYCINSASLAFTEK